MNEIEPSRFYDDLAEVYHLIYAYWEQSVARQGQQLAGILRERWPSSDRVLDAACGIGTQALGLAAEGFRVTASDVSPAAVARARREAQARGLGVSFSVADLRSLSAVHRGPFDAVIACDNSIPHLLTDADIVLACEEMRSLLRPGGGCLISVRDYGAEDRTGSRFIPYGIRETPEGRFFLFQVWDFIDEDHYDLSFFFVRDDPAAPQVRVFRTRYYAIDLQRLAALLRSAGFASVEVLTDRFFQPVLVGTNP